MAQAEKEFGRSIIRPSKSSASLTIQRIQNQQKAILANPNSCTRKLLSIKADSNLSEIECQEPARNAAEEMLYDATGKVVFSTITHPVPVIAVNALCKKVIECLYSTTTITISNEVCFASLAISTRYYRQNAKGKGICTSSFPKDDYVCSHSKTMQTRACDVTKRPELIVSKAYFEWVEEQGVSCGVSGDQWMQPSTYDQTPTNTPDAKNMIKNLEAQSCESGEAWRYGSGLKVQVIPSRQAWQNKQLKIRITFLNTKGDGGEHYMDTDGGYAANDKRLMPSAFLLIDLTRTDTDPSVQTSGGQSLNPNNQLIRIAGNSDTWVKAANWTARHHEQRGGCSLFGCNYYDGQTNKTKNIFVKSSCTPIQDKFEELPTGFIQSYGRSECNIGIRWGTEYFDRIETKYRKKGGVQVVKKVPIKLM